MKNIRAIHLAAMDFMRKANQFLAEGNRDFYLSALREALLLEEEAANELFSDLNSEPTRSVLFRSAANLAYNVAEYGRAEKLIHRAMAGNPPKEIEMELMELQDKIEIAFARELAISDIVDYNYLNVLKEKSVNLKVESINNKYSKAIMVDFVVDFLRNFQESFKNFSEVLFRKTFTERNYLDYDSALSTFKKESRLLVVNLDFQSFGVGIIADPGIMNYEQLPENEIYNFKADVFERFKRDVLFADFNSESFHKEIIEKYNELERTKIFSPIVSSLDRKSNYKVSISDKDFKFKVRDIPPLNKLTVSILKPKMEKQEQIETELLIKRTMELTDKIGKKKERLQSEFLSYAEFEIGIDNVNIKETGLQIFFNDTYYVKIVFSNNIFFIDDSYFDIYIEGKDFKEIQKTYEAMLGEKFQNLKFMSDRSLKEQSVFDNMINSFLSS